MVSLSALLDPGITQPASCLIEVGEDFADIGIIADLVMEVEITTARAEAATGTIIIEDRRKEDGQWIAADSGLFTRWAPIRISADFQTHVEEIFRGFIVQPGSFEFLDLSSCCETTCASRTCSPTPTETAGPCARRPLGPTWCSPAGAGRRWSARRSSTWPITSGAASRCA